MPSADPLEPTSRRFSEKAKEINECKQCLDRAGRKAEQEESCNLVIKEESGGLAMKNKWRRSNDLKC